MLNFDLHNPTKVCFGKGQIAKLSNEIPKDAKVLILYGKGSVKKNGIYEQVKEALKDYETLEFGGIPANPEHAVLVKALKIIKEENVTFLLALGGGSVIDGTKFLASAALFEGEDSWDILKNGIRTNVGMPFGTVLTMPATGSEMNSGAVITHKESQEKRAMGGPGLFPKFSILDPTVVASIPERQLANGITDAFTHVLEQYLTYPTAARLQERFAESILSTLIEIAEKLIKQPEDYSIASDFMWCCTMALNGQLQKGVPTDWATHMIGHELTALHNIDHARTLAIIAPRLYENQFETKKEKLAQYAQRIWDIKDGTTEEKAREAIKRTENFFHSLGIKTRLSDYTEDYKETASTIEKRFEERGWKGLGEQRNITPSIAGDIVRTSL